MKLIFGGKITRGVDKVWTTKKQKLNGIVDEMRKKEDEVFFILVIVHFEKTLEELRKVIDQQELCYKVFKTSWDISNFDIDRLEQEGLKHTLVLSDILSTLMRYDQLLRQTDTKKKKIHIIAAEHYPIPERDENILLYAAKLSQFTTVSFHTALDEPMLKLFGVESISGLLKNLGLKEKTFISHPMITTAIAEVQRKVKKQSIGDQRVNSQEEWFYYNYPQARNKMK